MKKQSNKIHVVLLLVAVFAAPGVAAYLFYQHPLWLGSTKVNKGNLLSPPVVLTALKGQSKWRVVFWAPSVCDKSCWDHLETLARVRLALGRKLYQVDQWLILGEKSLPLTQEEHSALKELDFHVAQLSAAARSIQATLSSQPTVFLADPNDYLILSYALTENPNDIYKDLHLLLNITTKNG